VGDYSCEVHDLCVCVCSCVRVRAVGTMSCHGMSHKDNQGQFIGKGSRKVPRSKSD
jgi:hypothetical protein